MIICNYVAVAVSRGQYRTVGWYGSLHQAKAGAELHNQQTGQRCYVTDYGQEISGKAYIDLPARW